VLNLITESYVSGLRGRGDIGKAWSDQFSTGAPSYSIGLQYEVPLGNRAANARHTRRRLELLQLRSQYETTVQTLKLETRVAVREVETALDELDTKLSSLRATQTKKHFIQRRWEMLPGQGRGGSFVLEELLAAQTQLALAENAYLSAIVTYNLALMNLKRATGTLLQHERVTMGTGCLNGLPTKVIDKETTSGEILSQPNVDGLMIESPGPLDTVNGSIETGLHLNAAH
ncbi:MAG: TolC family protein, partial [Planctomycetota bacterium]